MVINRWDFLSLFTARVAPKICLDPDQRWLGQRCVENLMQLHVYLSMFYQFFLSAEKQGDNVLGSIRPSVMSVKRPFDRVHENVLAFVRHLAQ